MKNKFSIYSTLFVICFHGIIGSSQTFAQFAPQVGFAGTTAIHADSNIFVGWATDCTINLGLKNIADSSSGFVNFGTKQDATGKADGRIVSLGDNGMATLFFENPIVDGPGFDFAVFENGFRFQDTMFFLELAFVEVSSNGIDFVRFEPTSHTQTNLQIGPFDGLDAAKINNLAGKYIAPYGTPFDLNELKDNPLVDVNQIHYVRVVDVVGSIDALYGTRDKNGNLINDPWPTPFPSSGFDLDAIGVINQKYNTGILESNAIRYAIYPNPVQSGSTIQINCNLPIEDISITDLHGNKFLFNGLSVTAPGRKGIYILSFRLQNHVISQKIAVY